MCFKFENILKAYQTLKKKKNKQTERTFSGCLGPQLQVGGVGIVTSMFEIPIIIVDISNY